MNATRLIKELRNQGYSDKDIANKTNISYVQIFTIRKGRTKKPNPSTCKVLADTFGYRLKYIDNEPHFYPIEDDDPAPPQGDYGTVAKKYATSLGYDGTPEGLDMFLRECRGEYRKLHTIRKLLSNSEDTEKSKIDGQ